MKVSRSYWVALSVCLLAILALVSQWQLVWRDKPRSDTPAALDPSREVERIQALKDQKSQDESTKKPQAQTTVASLEGQEPGEAESWISLATLNAGQRDKQAFFQQLSREGLSEEDARQVFDFVTSPPGDGGFMTERWKQDLIGHLQKRRPCLEGMGPALITVALDQGQPDSLRDIAIQRLGAWGETLHREQCEWGAPQIEALKQTLLDLSGETDQAFAGTALLGLQRLSAVVPVDEIGEVAGIVVQGATYSEASRATALGILASVNPEDALVMARTTANDANAGGLIRVAALNVLGSLEGDDAEAESIAAVGPSYVVQAANAAREQIRKRRSIGNKER